MDRDLLKMILGLVKPAVSTSDIIPSMRCVFFDGESARSWDGTVAASTPCSLDLEGGVSAPELIDWVSKANGDAVAIDETEGHVTFKCGRSKMTLPLLPYEDFDWAEQHDATVDVVALEDLQCLAAGFKRLGPAIGDDQDSEQHLGVNITANKDGTMRLLATNELIAMMQTVNCASNPVNVTVHSRFASLMGKLSKDLNVQDIRLGEDWSEFSLTDGTSYWCRNNTKGQFQDLEGLSVRTSEMQYAPLPEGFHDAVARAVAATKGSDEPTMDMKVLAKEIRLTATGKLAQLNDVLPSKGHASTEGTLVPKLLMAALMDADEYALDPEFAMVLRSAESQSVCMTVTSA